MTIGGSRGSGSGVALAQSLHHVDLRHEVIEAAGRENDVDDAEVLSLVDLAGSRLQQLVGDLELVLGELQQVPVLRDFGLHAVQTAGRLIVALHGDVGLHLDLAELSLDGLEGGLLGGDRRSRGRRGQGEEESETEEAKDRGPVRGDHLHRLLWGAGPAPPLLEVGPCTACLTGLSPGPYHRLRARTNPQAAIGPRSQPPNA